MRNIGFGTMGRTTSEYQYGDEVVAVEAVNGRARFVFLGLPALIDAAA